jgi:hypothetical protein
MGAERQESARVNKDSPKLRPITPYKYSTPDATLRPENSSAVTNVRTFGFFLRSYIKMTGK